MGKAASDLQTGAGPFEAALEKSLSIIINDSRQQRQQYLMLRLECATFTTFLVIFPIFGLNEAKMALILCQSQSHSFVKMWHICTQGTNWASHFSNPSAKQQP